MSPAQRRGALNATPPQGSVATSEITLIGSDNGAEYHSIQRGQWNRSALAPVADEATLADPPWVDRFVPGDAPADERASPSTYGIPQHSTTIEIVAGEQPGVLIDGVPADDRGDHRYWVPRFREQRVKVANPESPDDRSKDVERRLVAPLFISLRLEDGATRPQSAEVVVLQRTYDDGVEVMEATQLKPSYELQAYSVMDAAMKAVVLPYPACITRVPSLRIVDNDNLRRWNARAQLVQGNRLWAIAAAAGAAASAALGATADTEGGGIGFDPKKLIEPLVKIWQGVSSETPVRQLWRYAFLSVVPGGGRIFDIGKSLWNWKYNQYDATNPPPEGEVVDIALPEALQVMRRLIETRANGSLEKDRSVGLTPAQMRQKGWRKDSALLDWLVYGEKKIDEPGWISSLIDPAGLTVRKGGRTEGQINATNPLNVGSRAMGGNVLDPRGLDPYFCAEARCEYFIEVRVVSSTGERTTHTFDALRANAMDAGMLMGGYAEMRDKLGGMIDELEAKLGELQKFGAHWLTDRLFVTDSTVQQSWFLPTPTNVLRSLGFGKDRDQFARRWKSYVASGKRKELKGTGMEPLIIDVQALTKRLRDQVIGSFEKQTRRRSRRAFSLANEQLPDTPATKAPAFLEKLASAPIPDSAGLTAEQYDEFIEAQMRLYRQTLGLPATTRIPTDDPHLLRWRDIYAPFVPERYDARLAWYVVPKPIDANRLPPSGAVLRRLPQLATFASNFTNVFGGGAAVLQAKSVPHDSMSDRKGAKSAVDAARVIWQTAAKDFAQMVWTIEPDDGRPSAFHAIEISTEMPATGAGSPVDSNWTNYLSVSGMSGQVVPVYVGERIHAFEQTPDSALITAMEMSGGNRAADAGILAAHRLAPTSVSWAALCAVADGIVYAALERGTTFKLKDSINNAVLRAREAAAFAADMIDVAFGRSLKTNVLVPYDDMIWACIPRAGMAHAMLQQLYVLRRAQALNGVAGRTYTKIEFANAWPRRPREQATEFARSLRVLALERRFDIDAWPFTNLQSLVIQRPMLPLSHNAPYPQADSGLEEQLQAATSAFLRVRRLLERVFPEPLSATRNAMRCLVDVVASRPVVLQVAEYADRSQTLMLSSLLHAQKHWRPPVPPDRTRAIRSGMMARVPALLELMGELKLGEIEAPLREKAVATIASRQSSDMADRLIIPPCGMGAAGMLDVSNAQALEDAVVWLDVLSDVLDRAVIRSAADDLPSSPDITDWVLEVDELCHPFVVRTKPPSIQGVRRVRAPPESGASLLGNALPRTTMETCWAIRDLPADEQPTGTFNPRRRSLLWLVDRFIQLQLVAIAMRMPAPGVHRVRCNLPGAGVRELVFAATAMVVATAVRSTSCAWGGSLCLVVDGVDVDVVARGMAPVAALCQAVAGESSEDPLRAVSLTELCHVLAAVLE